MDFSKLEVAGKQNTKAKSKKIIPSKRKTTTVSETQVQVKKEPLMKNFNISMYKQVFQSCDTCDCSTVQYMKDGKAICIYCKGETKFQEYNSIPVSLMKHYSQANQLIWF